jgi:hypothetical protein
MRLALSICLHVEPQNEPQTKEEFSDSHQTFFLIALSAKIINKIINLRLLIIL